MILAKNARYALEQSPDEQFSELDFLELRPESDELSTSTLISFDELFSSSRPESD